MSFVQLEETVWCVDLLQEEGFGSEDYAITQILIAKSFHFTIYILFLLAFPPSSVNCIKYGNTC